MQFNSLFQTHLVLQEFHIIKTRHRYVNKEQLIRNYQEDEHYSSNCLGSTVGSLGSTVGSLGSTVGSLGSTVGSLGSTVGSLGSTVACVQLFAPVVPVRRAESAVTIRPVMTRACDSVVAGFLEPAYEFIHQISDDISVYICEQVTGTGISGSIKEEPQAVVVGD